MVYRHVFLTFTASKSLKRSFEVEKNSVSNLHYGRGTRLVRVILYGRNCQASFIDVFNNQFPHGDMPARNHGICSHRLGLDVCFNDHNNHDSLQACLIVRRACREL